MSDWDTMQLCSNMQKITKKSLLERTGPTDSEECKENSKQGMGACPSNPNSSVWMKYLK